MLDTPEIEGAEMPKPHDFLSTTQKDGTVTAEWGFEGYSKNSNRDLRHITLYINGDLR